MLLPPSFIVCILPQNLESVKSFFLNKFKVLWQSKSRKELWGKQQTHNGDAGRILTYGLDASQHNGFQGHAVMNTSVLRHIFDRVTLSQSSPTFTLSILKHYRFTLDLSEFLQASDDSFRLRLLELDRNYDILTYCLQNNRSAPELIQHISEASVVQNPVYQPI